MVICAVFGCKSNNDKRLRRNITKTEPDEIKFFRFPKNEHYAKLWADKCGRSDNFNMITSYICSKHFTREQFQRNLKHELLKYSPKNSRLLKCDAIPTENLPSISEAMTYSEMKQSGRRKSMATDFLNLQRLNGSKTCAKVKKITYKRNRIVQKSDKATSTDDLIFNQPPSRESSSTSYNESDSDVDIEYLLEEIKDGWYNDFQTFQLGQQDTGLDFEDTICLNFAQY